MRLRLINNPIHRGDVIGIVAFFGVVMTSYITFISQDQINGEPWQVVVTFTAGTLFLLLGFLSTRYMDEEHLPTCIIYWGIQTVLAMIAIHVSPVRGFFGILALPLASQSVFIFRWPWAISAGVFLYLATSFVYYPLWGWSGFGQALIAYSPGYLFTIGFSFVTVNAVQNHKRLAILTEELEAANEKLRDQAEQAEELATTRERNRLAREIHDGVGHYLTVINVQLEAARTVLAKDPDKAAGAVEKAARLSREALDDVRRSVGSLRTEADRPALTDALKALQEDAGLPVVLAIDGQPRKLASAAEHALLRAAQEGLTNVRKHAHARHADVKLDFSDAARVRLSVIDDGVGGSPNQPDAGFGLRGMQERFGLLGGQVEAGPLPHGGFKLQVEVPA